ncbi:MAG: DnaJ domain-containing protein [Flavobacteriaceae bacterium]|nr:DnaJ domain-containing protein [Flavobacteriaceae bacterium]
MKDYYKILGIEKNAHPILIKKAFKKLAKEFHPDLNKLNTHLEFIEINEAYEVLNDDFERIKYNKLYAINTLIKEKPKKKYTRKKIKIYIFFFTFTVIAGSYYFSNFKDFSNFKNKKEELLIKKQKEKINFNSNTYFKEIQDEVPEDEIQDFTVYKDVPEKIINNTTQIKNDATVLEKQIIVKKNKPIIKGNTLHKKRKPNKNSKVKIIVANLEILSLQHTRNKYIVPKELKNLNAFKISLKLNNLKQVNNQKIAIMLVIKDLHGKLLIIDEKEIIFNNQMLPLTFYKKFDGKFRIGEEYTFSIFANKRLIKYTTKRI